MSPSTAWTETIAPDEETRFAAYAEQLVALQRETSARLGPGRALHRKQLVGARARFEVLADLPEAARHGLFAAPRAYDAVVRLSNGGAGREPDRKPDVHGFAFAVKDVVGPSALGGEASETREQCFLLIATPAFGFEDSAAFIGVALSAAKGPPALVKHLVGRHGLFAGLREAARLAGAIGRPFHGYATETFFTAAPFACGPYAARARLVPRDRSLPPKKASEHADDLAPRLLAGPIAYDFQLQFFVDEQKTPIEDFSREWLEADAPFVTVATLTLLQQDLTSDAGKAFAAEVEAGVFDPWVALAAHRPLGDVMRARKVAYFASQRERGAVG